MSILNGNSHPQPTIGHIASGILASGRITRADERFFLHATIAETPLSPNEMAMVVKIQNRLRMGLIKVAD